MSFRCYKPDDPNEPRWLIEDLDTTTVIAAVHGADDARRIVDWLNDGKTLEEAFVARYFEWVQRQPTPEPVEQLRRIAEAIFGRESTPQERE